MNYKERFLATLRGEPTDCIPYIPRLDLWYKANKRRGTLPNKYRNASLVDIVDDLDIGFHSVITDHTDFIDPLDQIDRGIGIHRVRLLPYETHLRDIKRNVVFEGDMMTVEYLTPLGNIRTKVLHDESMRNAGITVSHVVEHAIKSVDDYKAIAYIFEHIEVEPAYHKYLVNKEEVGNRGVAVVRGCVGGSPMHFIEHELMPYDLFFFHFFDHPEELKWLADKIDGYYKRVVEVAADSPAEVVFVGANFDSSVTWPPFFAEHVTPSLAATADMIHSKGKYLLSHPDGENKGLLDSYLESKIDIADSICPDPMSSLRLKEIKEAFDGKITIWGAIPSVITLESSMSDYDFEKYMNERVFEEAGRGDHLVLSIADTTPPDANFSRIEKIARMAKEFGPVKP